MAALLYGANVGVILLSRSLVQREALRGGVLIPEADVGRYRRETMVSWVVVAYWVATLPFIWWAPWSEIPWFFASGVRLGGSRVHPPAGAHRPGLAGPA